MKRVDLVGTVGFALMVVGFGGGVEVALLRWAQAYNDMAAAGGHARPEELAFKIADAYHPLIIGIALGMLGMFLFAFAIRRGVGRILTEVRACAGNGSGSPPNA